jgi:hypothetical protein
MHPFCFGESYEKRGRALSPATLLVITASANSEFHDGDGVCSGVLAEHRESRTWMPEGQTRTDFNAYHAVALVTSSVV